TEGCKEFLTAFGPKAGVDRPRQSWTIQRASDSDLAAGIASVRPFGQKFGFLIDDTVRAPLHCGEKGSKGIMTPPITPPQDPALPLPPSPPPVPSHGIRVPRHARHPRTKRERPLRRHPPP